MDIIQLDFGVYKINHSFSNFEAERFKVWFDKEIGTEYDLNSTGLNAINITVFDIETIEELKKIKNITIEDIEKYEKYRIMFKLKGQEQGYHTEWFYDYDEASDKHEEISGKFLDLVDKEQMDESLFEYRLKDCNLDEPLGDNHKNIREVSKLINEQEIDELVNKFKLSLVCSNNVEFRENNMIRKEFQNTKIGDFAFSPNKKGSNAINNETNEVLAYADENIGPDVDSELEIK